MNSSSKVVLLFFICLLTIKTAIIVETNKNHKNRLLDLNQDVVDKVNVLIHPPFNLKVDISDSCTEYDSSNVNKLIQVCVQQISENSKTLKLELRSPMQTFELELAEIDLQTDSPHFPINDLLKQFNDNLQQLVLDDKTRLETVKMGIEKAIKILEIRTEQTFTDSSVTFIFNNLKHVVNFKLKENLLELKSEYVNYSVELTPPIQSFIIFQSSELFQEIVHRSAMIKNLAIANSANIVSSNIITCQSVLDTSNSLQDFKIKIKENKLLILEDEIEMNESQKSFSFDVSNDNKRRVNVSCTQPSLDSFSVLLIKGVFANGDIESSHFSQSFLSNSLYDLWPFVDSFLKDLAIEIVRRLAVTVTDEHFLGIKMEEIVDNK